MYIVRSANISDLEKLKEFEQGVIEAERPFIERIKDGKIHYYDIVDLISNPDSELIIVEDKNIPIACGYAKIKNSSTFFNHEKHGYLGFMYVDPQYRGQGIAKLIVNHLIDWCKKRDIDEIQLDVYADNLNAIKSYEKVGFKANKVEMRLAVG